MTYILKARKPKALAQHTEAVKALILKNQGATIDEIADSLNRTEAVAHRAIAQLRTECWMFTQMRSRIAHYYSLEYALKNRVPHKIAQPYRRSKKTIPAVNESSQLDEIKRVNQLWPARS